MFLLNEWWSFYFQKFAPLYFCTEWVSVHDLGMVISQIHFSFSLLINPTSFLELFFHIMCVGCVHSILICSNTRDRMKSVTLLMRLLLFPQIRNTHCKKYSVTFSICCRNFTKNRSLCGQLRFVWLRTANTGRISQSTRVISFL